MFLKNQCLKLLFKLSYNLTENVNIITHTKVENHERPTLVMEFIPLFSKCILKLKLSKTLNDRKSIAKICIN